MSFRFLIQFIFAIFSFGFLHSAKADIAEKDNGLKILTTPEGQKIASHCGSAFQSITQLVQGNGTMVLGNVEELGTLIRTAGYRPEAIPPLIETLNAVYRDAFENPATRPFMNLISRDQDATGPQNHELLVCSVSSGCSFSTDSNFGHNIILNFAQSISSITGMRIIDAASFRKIPPRTQGPIYVEAVGADYSLTFRLPPDPTKTSDAAETLDARSQWVGQFFREGATYAADKLLIEWINRNILLSQQGNETDELFNKYVRVIDGKIAIDDAFRTIFAHSQASAAWSAGRRFYFHKEILSPPGLAERAADEAEKGHRSGTYKDLVKKIGDERILSQEFGISKENIYEKSLELRRKMEATVNGASVGTAKQAPTTAKEKSSLDVEAQIKQKIADPNLSFDAFQAELPTLLTSLNENQLTELQEKLLAELQTNAGLPNFDEKSLESLKGAIALMWISRIESANSAHAEFQKLGMALALNNRNQYIDLIYESVVKGVGNAGSDQFATQLIVVGTPAQTLALYALRTDPEARNPALFKAKMNYLIGNADEPEGFKIRFGIDVTGYQQALHRVSEQPGLVAQLKVADKIFKELLPTQKLYDEFAHHPALLPYVFATFIEPDSETSEVLRQGLKNKIELQKLDINFDSLRQDIEAQLKAKPELVNRIKELLLGPKAKDMKDVKLVSVADVMASYNLDANKKEAYLKAIAEAIPPEIADVFLNRSELSAALSLFIMGLDSHAAEIINSLPLSTEERQRIGSALVKMSKNQNLQRAYSEMSTPNLLRLLFVNAIRNQDTIERYGVEFPVMNVRVHQLMATQIVTQFAPSTNTPNSSAPNILEIGYGVPSVLAALKPLYRGNAVGVDILPIITKQLPPGIDTVQGNIPTDAAATSIVKGKGPYRLIYAIDTLKSSVGFGVNFNPNVDSETYLKFIYENLEEGGTFVIVNSGDSAPTFTIEQARKAGFKVVRWAVKREMNAKEAELNKDSKGFVDHVSYYVLRRGDLKVPLQVQKLKEIND